MERSPVTDDPRAYEILDLAQRYNGESLQKRLGKYSDAELKTARNLSEHEGDENEQGSDAQNESFFLRDVVNEELQRRENVERSKPDHWMNRSIL